MAKKQAIQLFEERKVRTVWDDNEEKWYFSIVDVVAILTDSKDPTAYWRKLKQRLKKEGNETVTNCHGLKMLAADGKMRLTDEKHRTSLQEGQYAMLSDIIAKARRGLTINNINITRA